MVTGVRALSTGLRWSHTGEDVSWDLMMLLHWPHSYSKFVYYLFVLYFLISF